jgi:hypothetical protein
MGLTIHYTISGRARLKLPRVQRIVSALRKKAVALGFERVTRLIRVGPDFPFAYWRPPGAKRSCDLVPPSEGWVFHATPGDGSESAMMGLCRFEGREGWWLESFCKTQYASRHGWEHFLKCHCAVIQLIEEAKRFGLNVEVEDEGGLWETGSVDGLRKTLDEYNGWIAALAGALKDAGASDARKIEAPIFDHPQFEHLEARGLAEHGEKVGQSVEIVKRLVK